MKFSRRTILIALVVFAVIAFGSYKIGKRIANAYAEYDASQIKDRGEAPALQSALWYNVPAPVQLANLRGQVVVIDFWRFQCPECVHSMPHIVDLYDRYKAQGVKFLSVHSPETPAEYDQNSVQAYIAATRITFPVAIDTDHTIFNAYRFHAWPTLIVIDRQGRIRYQHIGEGRYDEIEAAIKTMMAEPS